MWLDGTAVMTVMNGWMNGWMIYPGNTTLYLTAGGAIGHNKSPSTEPKLWNTDQAQFHSTPPRGHVCLLNRCHPYGWTHAEGSEVFSSPQSHPDNIGGCFLFIWKSIYSVWLPLHCAWHHHSHSSAQQMCPRFLLLLINLIDFKLLQSWQVLCCFFPVLNLSQMKTMG